LHALRTNVSGDSVSLPESKTEISVNYQCSRTAVYEVGSLTPKTVLLQGVSRSTSIVGENIGRVISYSGNNASLNLSIGEFGKLTNGGFNPSTDTKLFIGITGRVVSQNLSFATNRIADGSISLVENLY
jgi:hypothetical protein